MGVFSFHLTMRLTIFCYFWVLLVPMNAKDDFMSNSTRTTTETLWEMRDHPNDILNIVYEILRGYALDCCTNPDYGFGLPETNCETKQLAFWASVDKDVWDEDDPNNANQDLDLMNWLEDNYNPNLTSTEEARYICKGTGNDNDYYPNFAKATRATPPDVGHTEAKLIAPMTRMAQVQSEFGYQQHFFLYTYNSPCCEYKETCLKKIFKFTFDEIYDDAQRSYHSLDVLLYQWYINSQSPTIPKARENFCTYVTELKRQYTSINFSNGLSFKKILTEPGDDDYHDNVMVPKKEC